MSAAHDPPGDFLPSRGDEMSMRSRARLLASARAEAHDRSGSTESIPLGCPTIRPQILASSHPPRWVSTTTSQTKNARGRNSRNASAISWRESAAAIVLPRCSILRNCRLNKVCCMEYSEDQRNCGSERFASRNRTCFWPRPNAQATLTRGMSTWLAHVPRVVGVVVSGVRGSPRGIQPSRLRVSNISM